MDNTGLIYGLILMGLMELINPTSFDFIPPISHQESQYKIAKSCLFVYFVSIVCVSIVEWVCSEMLRWHLERRVKRHGVMNILQSPLLCANSKLFQCKVHKTLCKIFNVHPLFSMQDTLCEGGRRYSIKTKETVDANASFLPTKSKFYFSSVHAHQWTMV